MFSFEGIKGREAFILADESFFLFGVVKSVIIPVRLQRAEE